MSAAILSLLAARAKAQKPAKPVMSGYESFATFEGGFYTLRSLDHVTGQERTLSTPVRMTKAQAKRQARVDGVAMYPEQPWGAVGRAALARIAAGTL